MAEEVIHHHGLTFASCLTRSLNVSEGPRALLRSLVAAYGEPQFVNVSNPRGYPCTTLRLGLVLCGSREDAMRANHTATIETDEIDSESVQITTEEWTAEYSLPLDDSLDRDESARGLYDLVLGLAGGRGRLYGLLVCLANSWCVLAGNNIKVFDYMQWRCAVGVVEIDTGRAALAEDEESPPEAEAEEPSAEEPSAGSSSPESAAFFGEARCAVC